MGKASEALVSLTTTGNPDPLQADPGGIVVSSEDLQLKVRNLLNLEKQEHLAPKALVTPKGENYAMVGATITKDSSSSITKAKPGKWIWTIRMGIGCRLGLSLNREPLPLALYKLPVTESTVSYLRPFSTLICNCQMP